MSSNLQLIFKEATKSSGQRNVNMSILLDNALQHYPLGKKINKKMFVVRIEIRRGYPNPLRTGMRFIFLSLLDMDRVIDKYMKVEDGDGLVKIVPTPPHRHAYS